MKRKVLLLALVSWVFIGALAAAQEGLTPYASIRYSTGIRYQDDDYGGEDFTFLQSPAGSRAGLRYRGDQFELQAELRFNTQLGPGPVYLIWKPGDFSLLAGYTDAPTLYSSNISLFEFSHGGYGDSGIGRVPQIKAGYNILGKTGVYIALFETTGWSGITNPGNKNPSRKDDPTRNVSPLPPFALGLDYNSGNISIGGGFAGSLFKADETTVTQGGSSTTYDTVNDFAMIAYLHGNIKFGAPYIRFNAAFERSRCTFGMSNGNKADNSALEDNIVEGFLEFGYALDAVTFALAGGYVRNLTNDDNRLAVGLTAAIPVQKRLRIIPGVIYYNELETGTVSSSGSRVDAGVKLQLDL
ncbi:MAG: hypothetical protein LBK40_07310 [Spirochaetaceae bacterium]|jgi:hypothetical protein|nr:hypothetical protein [Spirochaetaceae bacterium]